MHPHEVVLRKSNDIFIAEDGTEYPAGIIASTKATYSMGSRAYYFEGVILGGVKVGDYMIRKLDGLNYMVATTYIEPMCPTIERVFFMVTNCFFDIEGKDEWGVPFWKARDVKGLIDTALRPEKELIDGNLAQEINTLALPNKCKIDVQDIVITKDIKGNALKRYRTDSVSDVLAMNGSRLEGVSMAQLTKDMTDYA